MAGMDESLRAALTDADRHWLREQGWTEPQGPQGKMIRRGKQTLHYCETPGLKEGHGAIWRCDCGQRWRLWLDVDTERSKSGRWTTSWWWPFPPM